MLNEVKKVIKEEKYVIGIEEVLKNLKSGKLTKVFLTSNCPDEFRKDIDHYSKIAGVEIIQLKQPNDELGILCKKPFSVSVLGVLKGA